MTPARINWSDARVERFPGGRPTQIEGPQIPACDIEVVPTKDDHAVANRVIDRGVLGARSWWRYGAPHAVLPCRTLVDKQAGQQHESPCDSVPRHSLVSILRLWLVQLGQWRRPGLWTYAGTRALGPRE